MGNCISFIKRLFDKEEDLINLNTIHTPQISTPKITENTLTETTIRVTKTEKVNDTFDEDFEIV
jgi:hypothetical protein